MDELPNDVIVAALLAHGYATPPKEGTIEAETVRATAMAIFAERQRCASVVLDHESIAGAIVYDLARAITKG